MKIKNTIIMILVIMLSFGNVASAAEIFQWIVEPSLVYEDIYYYNDNFYSGYWKAGNHWWSDGKYDIIDSYGNTLITDAQNLDYNEDLNFVLMDNGYVVKVSDGKSQLIDATGVVKMTTDYTVSSYHKNTNLLEISVPGEYSQYMGQQYKYGLLDLDGNVIIPIEYDMILEMDDSNWFLCEKDEKYGIIDKDGTVVHDIIYDEVNWNSYMIACVKNDPGEIILYDRETNKETRLSGKAQLFYTNFNWPLYETDEFLLDGQFVNTKGEVLTEKSNTLRNMVDKLKSERKMVESTYDSSYYYMGNEICKIVADPYTKDEEVFYINNKGERVFEGYRNIWRHTDNVYHVTDIQTDKSGVVDASGNIILPLEYEYTHWIHDSLIGADGEVYDITGKKLDIGEYMSFMSEGDYFFIRDENNKVGFAKMITVPDGDIRDKIIMTVDEKDMYIWGKYQANDVVPMIRNDRTMLPVRAVAEALGAEVGWDAETQAVTVKNDVADIAITVGKTSAFVNGEEKTLDSTAFIDNDRTYLPVRFIVENLGAKVEWLADTRQIIVTK